MENKELTSLLEKFIQLYVKISMEGINGEITDEAGAVKRINCGDCGTAAIAVGYAYQSLYPDSTEVKFFDNFNHAFLLSGNLYYDTINVTGTSDVTRLTNHDFKDCKIEEITIEEMFYRYIRNDWIGSNMIKIFLTSLDVPVPSFVSAVSDTPTKWDKNNQWLNQALSAVN